MVNWYNFTHGREFTFISSALDRTLVKELVEAGFYWMGDPENVVCCGCLNSVKISAHTRSDHRVLVPDCFLLTLNIVIKGVQMPATVGMMSAESDLKDLLRNHRRTYSIASRARTFGSHEKSSLAIQGFVRKGVIIECTYCHFQTSDWNEETITLRHRERCPNCIFICTN